MKITLVNSSTKEYKTLSFKKFKEEFKTQFEYAKQEFLRRDAERQGTMPKYMRKTKTDKDIFLAVAGRFNSLTISGWCVVDIK